MERPYAYTITNW